MTTTSGTVGQTQIEVAAMIEHIGRRCGITTDRITPEIIATVKNVIFMFCTSLSNRGINLWRVQRGLFGINPGQATYIMPAGTLDIISANYRVPQRLGGTITSSAGGTVANLADGDRDTVCTQSSSGGNLQWQFTTETMVNLVGLLSAATTTNTLIFEVSDDGAAWTAVRTPGATDMVDQKWKWFNIEPAKSALYFRVRETSSGTLSLREVTLSSSWSETQMYRMSRDEFINIPNKRSAGEPRQYWHDRQSAAQMLLWPTPDEGASMNVISLWSHMQVQDIGAISNILDIPQRWYDAVVANCAFMAILDIPGADLNRYDKLKDQALLTLTVAEAEERDNTPTEWLPNISGYTA
jgi:hypothetical protein